MWCSLVAHSSARKLFRKGFKALKRGDFTGALEFFQRARNLEPDVPSVYHNIAVAYMKLGYFRDAEKHLLEALRLDSSYRFALISLANLRLLEGRVEEAWEFLSSVAKMYLEDGLPFNLDEFSYFVRTFTSLTEEGRVSEELKKEAEDVLDKLIREVPADAPPELMLLKAAIGLKEHMGKWREHEMRRRLRMKSAPINPDAPLEDVLFRYNKCALVGMGKILQIKSPLETLKKAELVGKICAYLRDLKFLGGIVEGLKPEERIALLKLMLKGGVMSWAEFAEKHGSDLDESIYWNWHPPKTIMGRLKARGLAVDGSFDGKEWILVPQELRPLLLAIQRLEGRLSPPHHGSASHPPSGFICFGV